MNSHLPDLVIYGDTMTAEDIEALARHNGTDVEKLRTFFTALAKAQEDGFVEPYEVVEMSAATGMGVPELQDILAMTEAMAHLGPKETFTKTVLDSTLEGVSLTREVWDVSLAALDASDALGPGERDVAWEPHFDIPGRTPAGEWRHVTPSGETTTVVVTESSEGAAVRVARIRIRPASPPVPPLTSALVLGGLAGFLVGMFTTVLIGVATAAVVGGGLFYSMTSEEKKERERSRGRGQQKDRDRSRERRRRTQERSPGRTPDDPKVLTDLATDLLYAIDPFHPEHDPDADWRREYRRQRGL